jgi:preprotein translocase subunit YajC
MDSLISVLTFLQAADPQGGSSLLMTGVTFGAVILIFYFLIIRPQNKKQKELDNLLKGIKKGDKVYTIGGMHGVVHSINEKDNTVTLKVDEGSTTTLEFNKSSIAGLVNPPVAKKEPKEPKEAKEKKPVKSLESASEEKK